MQTWELPADLSTAAVNPFTRNLKSSSPTRRCFALYWPARAVRATASHCASAPTRGHRGASGGAGIAVTCSACPLCPVDDAEVGEEVGGEVEVGAVPVGDGAAGLVLPGVFVGAEVAVPLVQMPSPHPWQVAEWPVMPPYTCRVRHICSAIPVCWPCSARCCS